MDFKNKNAAILGFGVEGESVANFLLTKKAHVSIFDVRKKEALDADKIKLFEKAGAVFKFDKYPDSFEKYDFVVRSPGVSPTSTVIERIREQRVEITSATKMFFDLCPCPIIGVTGTKGKGTTSTLIYEMLRVQGSDVYLGGNIGISPLEFVDSLEKESVVVLELSSFQLADLHKSPQIAVVLMVTSEHLDYHRDVAEYVDAKRNILRFQSKEDFAIVNHDYPASNESDVYTDGKVYKVSREGAVEQGCFVKGDFICLKMGEREEKVMPVADVLLPGRHNLENVCAAILAATIAGAQMEAIVSVIKTFKGLEHRLELVRLFNGVKYYNDSFSTTPETAVAAIEAFEDPEILILGGSSKNSDFTELGKTIREAKNIKAIIGIGDEWPRIRATIDNSQLTAKIYEDCINMREVVQKAREVSTLGDIVILSPACASFDMFKNYKERGKQFKDEVNALV
ncbi:MAG TPA: UDP-N-acetylmuramoyl-L-alanine--D-glutamate ligase [Patescibacteria group bacterium]|nr:UDP-N-acetylmuramoyl-L-alanine--D-glutamate ligase [Patescibacteria group bacterium]